MLVFSLKDLIIAIILKNCRKLMLLIHFLGKKVNILGTKVANLLHKHSLKSD